MTPRQTQQIETQLDPVLLEMLSGAKRDHIQGPFAISINHTGQLLCNFEVKDPGDTEFKWSRDYDAINMIADKVKNPVLNLVLTGADGGPAIEADIDPGYRKRANGAGRLIEFQMPYGVRGDPGTGVVAPHETKASESYPL